MEDVGAVAVVPTSKDVSPTSPEIHLDDLEPDNGVDDLEPDNGVDVTDTLRTPAAAGPLAGDQITPSINLESSGESVEPPSVGTVYATADAIEEHYIAYAKQQGFGVARVGFGVNKKKEIRNVTWRCHCHGKPDTRRRRRKITSVSYNPPPIDITAQPIVISTGGGSKLSKKVGCKAMVYASISLENTWVVRNVQHQHQNHILSPNQSKHIYQHRKGNITGNVKRKLFNHIGVGLSVPAAHDALAQEMHGVANVDITERDLRNEVMKQRKLLLKDGDANAMMAYFSKMHKDNQNFFYSVRWHEKDVTLSDVMWVDARSRAAYVEFGEVVCFDTTYLTNKYDLPFANFIGVNHHGQSILLGCALISHETSETFEWLFSEWLVCMGKAPKAILTDQAAAFIKPLQKVMPDTRHRWCLWHILAKFPQRLGNYHNYDYFINDLKDIIYDSYSPAEFKERWENAVVEHDIGGCVWLSDLIAQQEMWVPAYHVEFFWAGMKTTQRVESINAFFKHYLLPNTTLFEFAKNYCYAMEKRARKEVDKDYDSRMNVRQLKTDFMIERVFRECYTDKKFLEFQNECEGLIYVNGRERNRISLDEVEHVIEDRIKSSCAWRPPKKRHFRVKYDTLTHDVSCECKMFETKGIMCRHTIRVYDLEDVSDVPEKYILRRWRKDVKRKHSMVKVAYHDPSKTIEVKRFDTMMLAFENVALTAMDHEPSKEMVLCVIKDIEKKVKALQVEAKKTASTVVKPVIGPLKSYSGRSLSNNDQEGYESETLASELRSLCSVTETMNPDVNCPQQTPEESYPGTQESLEGNVNPGTHETLPSKLGDPCLKKPLGGRPQTNRLQSQFQAGGSWNLAEPKSKAQPKPQPKPKPQQKPSNAKRGRKEGVTKPTNEKPPIPRARKRSGTARVEMPSTHLNLNLGLTPTSTTTMPCTTSTDPLNLHLALPVNNPQEGVMKLRSSCTRNK